MLAIGIAYAEWAPGRAAPLHRLLTQLRDSRVTTVRSQRKEHANVWAVRLWAWAETVTASHVILLNDDVTVCPEFALVCAHLVKAVPDEVISLHTSLGREPVQGAWQRSYWLTGPGYILPRARIRDLLRFVKQRSRVFSGDTNEDGMIAQWAWHEQRPIWHSLPAIVRHDTAIASTLGYDAHPMRVTNVPWSDLPEVPIADPDYWRVRHDPPIVPCPWLTVGRLRANEARGSTPATCAFCHSNTIVAESGITGAAMCRACLASAASAAIGGAQ